MLGRLPPSRPIVKEKTHMEETGERLRKERVALLLREGKCPNCLLAGTLNTESRGWSAQILTCSSCGYNYNTKLFGVAILEVPTVKPLSTKPLSMWGNW